MRTVAVTTSPVEPQNVGTKNINPSLSMIGEPRHAINAVPPACAAPEKWFSDECVLQMMVQYACLKHYGVLGTSNSFGLALFVRFAYVGISSVIIALRAAFTLGTATAVCLL